MNLNKQWQGYDDEVMTGLGQALRLYLFPTSLTARIFCFAYKHMYKTKQHTIEIKNSLAMIHRYIYR